MRPATQAYEARHLAYLHAVFADAVALGTRDSNPKIKPDPGLWFPDGNVCIVAGDKSFRVHKGWLSLRSEPFKVQVFEAGDRSGSDVTFQGVPVYHVPDIAEDMSTLLRAIYDGRKYLQSQAPHIRFSVLSALMRLGHKYALADIVADATAHLEDYFTSSLTTWLQRSSGTHPAKFCLSDKDQAAGAAFEAVNLARLPGQHALLPLALYHACQHSPEEIVRGFARARGAGGVTVARLAPDDMVRCIDARDGLLRASHINLKDVMASVAEPCSPDCTARDACARNMAILYRTYVQVRWDLLTTDALAGLETQLGALARRPCWLELCGRCRDGLVRRHRVKQRETWWKLLDILDLSAEELGIEWETHEGRHHAVSPQANAVGIVS
ncbi:hypothetical protein VTO73DRAFT_8875 [Trametes versicolor]